MPGLPGCSVVGLDANLCYGNMTCHSTFFLSLIDYSYWYLEDEEPIIGNHHILKDFMKFFSQELVVL